MPESQDIPGATSCCPELFIEIGMQLIMESCSTNEKVACELIGMRCGEYLILRRQKDNYSNEFHTKGKPITVTSNTYPGCVVIFSSRVIQHISSPDKLFFVEYRQTVESQGGIGECSMLQNRNLRASNRIGCFVPVHLSSGETVINAQVDNISTTGCCCLIADDFFYNSLEIHALVSIKFSSKLSINGQIRSIRREFLHNHHVGISFIDIDDDTKRKLTELIPSLRF